MDCYGLKDTSSWSLEEARKALQAEADWETSFTKCLYRPFDIRHIYYSKLMLERPVYQIHRHMLAGKNLGLLWTRPMTPNYQFSVLSTCLPADQCVIGNKTAGAGISYAGPLYLYPAEGEMQFEGGNRRPNLNPEFIKTVSDKLGLKFIEDGRGDLEQTFGPEDIFNYTYAVFHSPTYRTRYAEFLKIDFPRLPLTSDKELFKTLAEKGAALVSLHLMEAPVIEQQRTQVKFDVSGSNVVEKVTYNDTAKRVYINKEQYFEGVPPEAWSFHIGGYQVCQKWLKDRKGRTLTYDELTHYQEVVVALKETIRLMGEIDELIPGWPVA
jgi:predicted helicase